MNLGRRPAAEIARRLAGADHGHFFAITALAALALGCASLARVNIALGDKDSIGRAAAAGPVAVRVAAGTGTIEVATDAGTAAATGGEDATPARLAVAVEHLVEPIVGGPRQIDDPTHRGPGLVVEQGHLGHFGSQIFGQRIGGELFVLVTASLALVALGRRFDVFLVAVLARRFLLVLVRYRRALDEITRHEITAPREDHAVAVFHQRERDGE